MQPLENPARLHGNSTEGFFLKNLYCLECKVYQALLGKIVSHTVLVVFTLTWLLQCTLASE